MAIKIKENIKNDVRKVNNSIDIMVDNAQDALNKFMNLNQKQIDKITKDMAIAGVDNHMSLAKLAVEETKRGVYEDKITKNLFSTEYIYNNIKNEKTVGIINNNKNEETYEVAEPIGVVVAVTPVTNPTSTTMFKAIIAIKARNPIIFAFHPSAQQCSAKAAEILREAAIRAGAPKNCIQWIEKPSIEGTQALMNHKDISMVLATGGAGMVKSAYSTGKPALGVGPGNVPCYIEKTANVKRAATDLILSKTFDNGMICASEQAVIVDKDVVNEFEKFASDNGCYFLNEEEIKKLEETAIDSKKCSMNPNVVGQSAYTIAKMVDIKVDKETKVLIAKQDDVGPDYPLSREKLSPILAYYVVENSKEGINICEKMVNFGGLGHSAVIHSNDDKVINDFSLKIKVGRLLVNSPSTHGAIGDIYNTNTPSLTLGCGSFGKNSTTSNVTSENLINIKRVAGRKVNMQWFKIPEKIYFEEGSTQYLKDMPNITKAFIVTDPYMVKLGYIDKVLYQLRNRNDYVHCEIFSDVEPDPSVETVLKGSEMMNKFQPDVIIAVGGGSAMDAAKGMWLFYENPDVSFSSLKLKFMDIRKRVYNFPKLGNKAKMVAIPTTSGTGSEVTSFAVITDKNKNIKYPLADYELTPDVAIIDSDYVMSVPASVTADTGMDVLTHAIEAYVSVLASDFTDGLAIKAIQLVFEYLPKAFKNGNDKVAREKMHNASCIAGMAFTNAFLGINHSLAHKLGGEFHIPHGRANAILLPYVIEYNAAKPTKFASFPKYETFVADKKYAEIARAIGLKVDTADEGVKNLVKSIKELMKEIKIPMKISECKIDKELYLRGIEELADKAFEDQCTTANPKMPLVKDLVNIYKKAY